MPSQKKYPVTLDAGDREALERVTRTGVHPASVIRRARLLLAAGDFQPVTRAGQALRRTAQQPPLARLPDSLPLGTTGDADGYLGVLDRVLEDRLFSAGNWPT